ncbi:uncharacterized protein LACBIDRAFT_307970 [Laccaria bicolor S238N-H82]|uniref:Predicted protein n=1 Tax=Laccaria bicolor (strain S238N-H82 / ATCC MYA-4686) TaxID=486041 RepID=B0DRB5_LACBS|nr:uncharacterized protein LACBIDRAFT_307970 [Laccaria bicolor S238N-H82]EDR02756.1 predicted protein [Laccaria bicolor S238N-H82]|eukprot:XP_001886466.1 predicted protein [Laccaria bicolor S238N-H82]
MKKRDPPHNTLKHLYRAHSSASHYRQCYPPPTPLTSSRFASHLKRDILQPQPIPRNNSSILPSAHHNLGASLGMSTNDIDDCWDLLQDYVWEIPGIAAYIKGLSFVQTIRWPCGLS